MSKQIHEKDIDEEKQVFEVTLPINQLEKLQICVGNAYESTPDTNKYNIYNVDKGSKKVTECIGYYELPKDTNVLDKDGDFNVRELGEEKMVIYEDFKSKKGKSKPVKKAKKVVEDDEKEKGDQLPNVTYGVKDEQYYIRDYFNGNYKLERTKIVPTYLENLETPRTWANDVAISLTGMFSNVYIIIANENFLYTGLGEYEKPALASTPLLDLDMSIHPANDELFYDESIEYVIVSYKSQTHYRLVQHKGKVKFKEDELPNVIVERFCKRHHPGNGPDKGVDNDTFDTTVIETAESGDCFFDSIYRAVRADDPDRKPAGVYLDEVHQFRKEIAKEMAENDIAKKIINQVYIRYTEQSYDVIRNEFYKNKNKSTVLEPTDDNVFQFAVASIFGKEHDSDEFTFEEKKLVLTTFLTLFYEFVPVVTEESKDDFKEKYIGIYGYSKGDIKGDSVDVQRANLKPLFANVQKPEDKAKKPKGKAKVVIVSDSTEEELPKPVIEPEPPKPKPGPKPKPAPKPAPEPAPEPEPKPAPVKNGIEVPDGTDPDVAEIIAIYNSSDTDKREKLNKYKQPSLLKAWGIIEPFVNGQSKTKVNKGGVNQLRDCLAGDTSEKCIKPTKKAGGAKSSKYTRRK